MFCLWFCCSIVFCKSFDTDYIVIFTGYLKNVNTFDMVLLTVYATFGLIGLSRETVGGGASIKAESLAGCFCRCLHIWLQRLQQCWRFEEEE